MGAAGDHGRAFALSARAATEDRGGADPSRSPVLLRRSVTVAGHRTSVTLEAAFWQALRSEAARRGLSMNALVTEIDAARPADCTLSSALRVAVLRSLSDAAVLPAAGDRSPTGSGAG